MVLSTPWEAPPNLCVLQPKVTTSKVSKVILTDGLFPQHNLRHLIWVKDDGSPTRYGQQQPFWDEQAMLWDIPVLFLVSLW